MPEGWNLVTLKSDVDIQSAPRNIVETRSAASSGPERTAPQDSKTVIDLEIHLRTWAEGETLLREKAGDDDDGDEYGDEDDNEPSEPTGKKTISVLFKKERYDIVSILVSVNNPMNPSEFFSKLAK